MSTLPARWTGVASEKRARSPTSPNLANYSMRVALGVRWRWLVWEMDTPERCSRLDHLDAQLEQAALCGSGHPHDAEFRHVLVEAVEDFKDRAQPRLERRSEERTESADRHSFGRRVYRLPREVIAEDFDGDADQ